MFITIFWILIINYFLGAIVCASLDTKDKIFYNWYKEDPTGGLFCFIILEAWPIIAILMLKYRKNVMEK